MLPVGIKANSRKRIIKKFAEKSGLVYFGFVDQKSDYYKMVRGFTAMASHHDNNYCIGTCNGYSTTFVERHESIWQPDGKHKKINWLIMAFELKSSIELPHFLIKARHYNDQSFAEFFSANHLLKEFSPGTFEKYDADFTSCFAMYTKPTDSIDIERLITAKSARVMAAHFWPLSVEMWDNVLYVYASSDHMNSALLETILKNGLWLAQTLDTQSVDV